MAGSKGNGDGNGRRQHKRNDGIDGQQQLQQQLLTAMAAAIGYGDIDSVGNGDCKGNGDSNGNCNGNDHGGLPLHVPAMCSPVAGTTPCLHPHGHKGKCIHQRCLIEVTLLKVFAPFQGGGFQTAHHGLFFCLILQLLFSLLNNPLFNPRIIQVLKNPVSLLMLYLFHSSKNPSSLSTIYPNSYCTCCQGKSGQSLQLLLPSFFC